MKTTNLPKAFNSNDFIKIEAEYKQGIDDFIKLNTPELKSSNRRKF